MPFSKKRFLVIGIVCLVAIILVGVGSFFSRYLGTRTDNSQTSSAQNVVLQGNLVSSNLASGNHTLTVQGKTQSGKVISNSVTMNIQDQTDPYKKIIIYPQPITAAQQSEIMSACRSLGDVSQVLNIKQFGAKGDGSTDDYAALRGAAAYISQPEQAGKTLYYPPGDYKVNQVINRILVPNPIDADLLNIRYVNAKNINIIGCKAIIDVKGNFQKQKRLFISDNMWRSDLQQMSPFDFLNSSGFTLAGFEIKGNVDQMTRDQSVNIVEEGGRGVSTSGSTNYVLEDLNIHGFSTDGMFLGIGYQYKLDTNVTVRNVITSGNGRQGLSIQQMRGATFTNVQFLDTGRTGQYGVHSPGAGVDIEPIYCVSGCPENSNRSQQGLANNTGDILFDHCTFTNNIGAQFVADTGHGTEQVTVQNSNIDAANAGSLGAIGFGVTDGLIQQNTIHTSKIAIITTASNGNIAIKGNTIIDDRTIPRTAGIPLLNLSAGTILFSNNKIMASAASYNSPNTIIADLSGVVSSSSNLFQTNLSNPADAYFNVVYGPKTKVDTDTFTSTPFIRPNGLPTFPNPYSQL